MSVLLLKEFCKLKNITGISKLNKSELFNKVDRYNAIIKIQRFFRSKYDKTCPICFDLVNKEYFVFKPYGQKQLIYYDLECLCNHLITTGDFRDPKTREVYTKNVLKKIDNQLNKNKMSVSKYNKEFKSVYNASCNKRYYKLIKDREDTVLILERCLDDIISSMISLIEKPDSRRGSINFTLHSILIPTFSTYYKKLSENSFDSGINLLNRTINSIVKIKLNIEQKESIEKSKELKESLSISDIVLVFLYQIKFGSDWINFL